MAEPLPDAQLGQLMESVRKQDELVHGWTRTLVTVQGGVFAAVGALWTTGSVGIRVKAVTTAGLAIVGIVAVWTCALAATSDLAWRARYIRYVKVLAPQLFADQNPDPEKRGRQATLYVWLGWTLTAFWSSAIIMAAAKWWHLR
jgi:hypothetical protein